MVEKALIAIVDVKHPFVALHVTDDDPLGLPVFQGPEPHEITVPKTQFVPS
jgi:hypothetical protein